MNKENEYLEMLRHEQELKQQADEEYLNRFREFAEFVESGECKVKEEEDDEQD